MIENNDLRRMVETQSAPARELSKSHALMRMLLLTCLLAMSQVSWCDNFLQNPSNFTAYVQGVDLIRLTLPTQMWSSFLNEGIKH